MSNSKINTDGVGKPRNLSKLIEGTSVAQIITLEKLQNILRNLNLIENQPIKENHSWKEIIPNNEASIIDSLILLSDRQEALGEMTMEIDNKLSHLL